MSAWTKPVPKKNENGDFPERFCPDEGTYPAVLVGIIDLGTHVEEYGGKSKDTHKILLVWELAGMKEPGTQIPVTIGRDYTFSLQEKANLSKLIGTWRGKPLTEGEDFDITKMLAAPCLLTISHKTAKESENVYAVVTGVSGWKGPMVQGKPKPAASITTLAWTFADGPFPDLGWIPFFCALGQVKEVVASAKERRVDNGKQVQHTQRGPTQGDADERQYQPPASDDDDAAPF